MWYPSQQHCQPSTQQPPSWHGYIHNFSSQQQQQQQQPRTYSRTTYYCNTDESSIANRANTHVISRNDKNESFVHSKPIYTDDINVTGTDYHNTNSTGSYSDEMSSLSIPYQKPITHWNPVIGPLTKPSIITNSSQQNPSLTSTSSSSSSSSPSVSGCWDWLLYSPEYYSHLYVPSSSFVQTQQQEDETDLLARLPTWLLAILYPSMKQYHTMDDENDSDQEISSLNDDTNSDEAILSMNIDKKLNKVSSNSPLSSENMLNNSQKISQNRSSTPDTDDGYQSASDASRSDCSQQSSLQYDHHNSKDDITINTSSLLVPKRISYAAAVKPMPSSINNKISPSSTPTIKTKTNASSSSSLTINDMLNNNGQKLKFVAPRFERMHHAKQHSSSPTTTKDSLLSTTSSTNRAQSRSINNNNQRNHINNSARRR